MPSSTRKKVICAWSGGKDGAMALHELLHEASYEITTLLTVITEEYSRVSMHGVRSSLMDAQASSLGIPLEKIYITRDSGQAGYEECMRRSLIHHKERGVEAVVFGDIFLADLRRYREDRLRETGMEAIFPLWGRDTRRLASSFIERGFRAVITCVDSTALDRSFAGIQFDRRCVDALPAGVDPCGENGEFHSFVYDGPPFKKPVAYTAGETVLRDGRFYFSDICE